MKTTLLLHSQETQKEAKNLKNILFLLGQETRKEEKKLYKSVLLIGQKTKKKRIHMRRIQKFKKSLTYCMAYTEATIISSILYVLGNDAGVNDKSFCLSHKRYFVQSM